MKLLSFLLLTLFGFCSGCQSNSSPSEQDAPVRQNVLFLAVDDLRPEINGYGVNRAVTPNFDRLIASGVRFERAYCSVPVCGASRASLLTGLHPLPERFINYGARIEEEAPGAISLPAHFKNNGYFTQAVGKIFHHPDDGGEGWSVPTYRPDYPTTLAQQERWRDYQDPVNAVYANSELPLGAPGPAWESAEVADNVYYDGQTTDRALAVMDTIGQGGNPFFLGVGFIRPHLPFNAPQRYWDMYDPAALELTEIDGMPQGAPEEAYHNFGELRNYTNITKDQVPIPDEQARTLIHGYLASISFIDAQVGRILDKLDDRELSDNTIVVLWGDHGWSLGEHGLWCKHSLFTRALRSPLVVRTPGGAQGVASDALVSFIDIFPSVVELAGLPQPEGLDGKSFAPLIYDPDPIKEINEFVFSRWLNGETVKSDRYTLTRYFNKEGQSVSSMLYDNLEDPEETVNVIGEADNAAAEAELTEALSNHIAGRK